MQHEFTLEYWQDKGWFVGRLREVPGVFSQGETLTELEANIRDAYELVVADAAPKLEQPVERKPLLLEVS